MHWQCKLISDDQLRSLLRASQLVKFMMIVGSRVERNEMPPAINMDGEGMPNEVPLVEPVVEKMDLRDLNGQKYHNMEQPLQGHGSE